MRFSFEPSAFNPADGAVRITNGGTSRSSLVLLCSNDDMNALWIRRAIDYKYVLATVVLEGIHPNPKETGK